MSTLILINSSSGKRFFIILAQASLCLFFLSLSGIEEAPSPRDYSDLVKTDFPVYDYLLPKGDNALGVRDFASLNSFSDKQIKSFFSLKAYRKNVSVNYFCRKQGFASGVFYKSRIFDFSVRHARFDHKMNSEFSCLKMKFKPKTEWFDFFYDFSFYPKNNLSDNIISVGLSRPLFDFKIRSDIFQGNSAHVLIMPELRIKSDKFGIGTGYAFGNLNSEDGSGLAGHLHFFMRDNFLFKINIGHRLKRFPLNEYFYSDLFYFYSDLDNDLLKNIRAETYFNGIFELSSFMGNLELSFSGITSKKDWQCEVIENKCNPILEDKENSVNKLKFGYKKNNFSLKMIYLLSERKNILPQFKLVSSLKKRLFHFAYLNVGGSFNHHFKIGHKYGNSGVLFVFFEYAGYRNIVPILGFNLKYFDCDTFIEPEKSIILGISYKNKKYAERKRKIL
ncbi:MAG: hypothetical protein CSB55_02390 [Candidatus Cloacimonadota bacterium]|nr:MAG: hypothetical protein CSB55_02390 [Candidatus Cloacimonadota bacterium]